MSKLPHNCFTCLYRHRPCKHWSKELVGAGKPCKGWRQGKCYTCKYRNQSEDEWYDRGCETWCMGGCWQYKRDWKLLWAEVKAFLKREEPPKKGRDVE